MLIASIALVGSLFFGAERVDVAPVCGEYERAVTAANGETFCVSRYAGPTQAPGSGDAATGDAAASSATSGNGGGEGNGCGPR
jgi:hypothetical protein